MKETNLKLTRDEFNNAIVAQDDDNDYSESGYVVLRVNNTYYIAQYSHCSCYGTYDALCNGGVNDDGDGTVRTLWAGSKMRLLHMAKELRDPSMPDRYANEKDYDYDHLCAVYEQVLKACIV